MSRGTPLVYMPNMRYRDSLCNALIVKKPADTEHQPAYGCVLIYCEVLLNILNLLTHLLDQHFQFNRGTGDIGIDGF